MNTRLWIPLALLVPFLSLTVYVLETAGFAGFYREALSSPSTVLMGTDLTIALGLVLVWMWRDARETAVPFAPYLVVTLAIGVAGPLAYLVHREVGRRRHATASVQPAS